MIIENKIKHVTRKSLFLYPDPSFILNVSIKQKIYKINLKILKIYKNIQNHETGTGTENRKKKRPKLHAFYLQKLAKQLLHLYFVY